MKSIELNVFTNSTISSPSTEMIENTVLSFNRAFNNNIKRLQFGKNALKFFNKNQATHKVFEKLTDLFI